MTRSGSLGQTKSFDRGLDTYWISEEGKLFRAKEPVIRSCEDSTVDMLVVPKDGEWDEPVSHSGEVCFYYSDQEGRWFEYCAYFSNGRLTSLRKKD